MDNLFPFEEVSFDPSVIVLKCEKMLRRGVGFWSTLLLLSDDTNDCSPIWESVSNGSILSAAASKLLRFKSDLTLSESCARSPLFFPACGEGVRTKISLFLFLRIFLQAGQHQ